MKMKPVLSSNITEVGFDSKTNTLAICFRGGILYHHINVPNTEYDSLMAAESIGAYYREAIRGRYKRIKVVIG